MFHIECYCPNSLSCNVYLVEKDGHYLLVDTGLAPGSNTLSWVKKRTAKLDAILLSHGHFDHIGGLLSFPSPDVYMGEEDYLSFEDPFYNGSMPFLGEKLVFSPANHFHFPLDKETIKIHPFTIQFLKTPYHTKGGMCFYLEEEETLFTGDSLFHLGTGRTDLVGGEKRKELSSLKKIFSLPLSTKVYPGHGEGTSLAKEKALYF